MLTAGPHARKCGEPDLTSAGGHAIATDDGAGTVAERPLTKTPMTDAGNGNPATMRTTLTLLAALVLVAGTAAAQETPAPPATTTEAPAAANGLSLGEPVAPDGGAIGTPYVEAEHGDWEIRCVRTETGLDPCQLYQLLRDDNDNAVAEFMIYPLLPAQGDVVAGATIGTPLETLLSEQVTVAIDGGSARRYPFTFCAPGGCFSRFGLTADDVTRFKRGNAASVTIVPLVAPDLREALVVSLRGFTAGFDGLSALMTERLAEAQALQQQAAEPAAD
jgi:invasion protein IalB